MKLRGYQQELVDKARESLKKHNKIVIQAPTGSGKSAIFTEILSAVDKNKKKGWVIVPRTELLQQSSEHLKKWKTSHGIIAPAKNESKAYNIHVVSKDTLIRRYDKIKIHPDLILIDECHIALERQKEIAEKFPDSKIIGFTATPERADGSGLSELYEDLICGPSIPWLTEHDYLSQLRYFSPPIQGLDKLRKKGSDYDANDLALLLEKNKVYGEAIKHYKTHADGKKALVFCRDVKSAYETAERFSAAGYNFECIEGKMSAKKRKMLLDGLKNGELHGLTNCEIATYGLDIPSVEVGIMLRPTMSRALYFQMVGRILRPFPGKTYAMIFDHVNNLFEHSEPDYPGIPPHYIEEIKWNFYGTKKRKSDKCKTCKYERKSCPNKNEGIISRCKWYEFDPNSMSLTLCPECWLNVPATVKICPKCGAVLQKRKNKKIEFVDTELKEITPVKLNDRPIEEKREIIDTINDNIHSYESGNITGAVGEMLKIADNLGYTAMWVYYELNQRERINNITLLHEIAKQCGYRSGWVHFQKKEIMRKKRVKQEFDKVIRH